MPSFLNLPRELRDMIYMELLTIPARPHPFTRAKLCLPLVLTHVAAFQSRPDDDSHRTGEDRCFSVGPVPPTSCAALLAVSRQIHAEVSHVMDTLRRRGELKVRMGCALEGQRCWVSWLVVPAVRTAAVVRGNDAAVATTWSPGWVRGLVKRYAQVIVVGWRPSWSTMVHRLQVDVNVAARAHRHREAYGQGVGRDDGVEWAVCAAVRKVLVSGPDLSASEASKHRITIEELILDVVTPSSSQELPDEVEAQNDDGLEAASNATNMARQLVDVWSVIWRGNGTKASFYRILVERISRVRVCVDGVSWRVRELGSELEKGQRERRRIAERADYSW